VEKVGLIIEINLGWQPQLWQIDFMSLISFWKNLRYVR